MRKKPIPILSGRTEDRKGQRNEQQRGREAEPAGQVSGAPRPPPAPVRSARSRQGSAGLGHPAVPHGGTASERPGPSAVPGTRPPAAPLPRATPRRHSLRREGTSSRPTAAAPGPPSSSRRRRRRQPARSRSRTAGIAPLRSATGAAGPALGRAERRSHPGGEGGAAPGGGPRAPPARLREGCAGGRAGKCRSCGSGRLPMSELWIQVDKILCNNLIFHLKTPTFSCLYPKYFYL